MDKNSKTIGEIRASGTFTTSNNFGVSKAQQIGSRMIDYALEATTFQKDSIDQKNRQWSASGEAVVLADLLGCQSSEQYSNPEEFIRLRNLAFRSLQKVSGVVHYNPEEAAIEAEVSVMYAMKCFACEIAPMMAPMGEATETAPEALED